MITETQRLILRELVATDAPALHPVFSDPECTLFTLRVHTAVDQTLEWILAIRKGYAAHGFAPWAVVQKSDNQLIGYCGCGIALLDGKKECEIGYRIVRSYWGQGFATEAVRATINYAFEKLPFTRLVALIQPENSASIRVAEKVGMTYHSDTIYEGIQMKVFEIHPSVTM